jgi:hypothetical protein
MKWYPLDAFDPRVAARGRWGDPLETWPNAPGVFVVATTQLDVFYVGHAASLADVQVSVLRAHLGLWLQVVSLGVAAEFAKRLQDKYQTAK